MRKISIIISFSSALGLLAGCDAEEAPEFRSIVPVCVEATPRDPEAWICPQTLEVECGEVPEFVHVVAEEGSCDAVSLASIDGPFGPGAHGIVVVDEGSNASLCEAELVVLDTRAPEVVTRPLDVWPPNHKMHAFDLHDCFEEVLECDPQWEARISYVASDEPEDATGDGNTAPDIELHDATHFSVRAERRGGGNGRVYTVGWEVRDGSGNATEGTCRVDVPHDRSGRPAKDDGEDHRVEFDS